MSRQDTIQTLRANNQVDVLVIGGGINGVGTFRDLAMQGVNVLLVEQGDFCSGTSSASSHMVHGGIRYLENGEFRLVREAVHERNRLLTNAPHLVKPLPTTIPIFKWLSGLLNAPLRFIGIKRPPNERGLLVIKLGLMMYDAFTRAQATVPRHHLRQRAQTLEHFPAMHPDILATATYYDAAMPSPERLLIEVLADGLNEGDHAKALNYVRAASLDGAQVVLEDVESGERIGIRPRIVVNAGGPWIDAVNQGLGQQTQFIGGTKGSHLVIDHPELRAAIHNNEIFFENVDGRIVLIYPLQDRVLVGTTDIPVSHPDEAGCTEEEVDYLLSMIRRVFPGLDVNRSHIVFRFSGVRPLPASGSAIAGQISRDHSIRIVEANDKRIFPILSLVGGKWTTFRAFSEQVTDAVLERLGGSRTASTTTVPIGGGREYPENPETWIATLAGNTGIDASRVRMLFERYGTRAGEIAGYIAAGDDIPLTNLPGYTQREVAYLSKEEWVIHLDDFIMRRSLIGMLGHTSTPLLVELAAIIGQELGWDARRQANEVARTRQIMHDDHQIDLPLPEV